MILFDTDTLTLFLTGSEKIKRRVEQADQQELIAITIVTRIEVLRGRFDFLLKAADSAQLLQAVARLAQSELDLQAFTVVPVDVAAATQFDLLRKDKKLRKVGRADLLIASIALARKATLVTRNVRHFQQVAGLRVENWAD